MLMLKSISVLLVQMQHEVDGVLELLLVRLACFMIASKARSQKWAGLGREQGFSLAHRSRYTQDSGMSGLELGMLCGKSRKSKVGLAGSATKPAGQSNAHERQHIRKLSMPLNDVRLSA